MRDGNRNRSMLFQPAVLRAAGFAAAVAVSCFAAAEASADPEPVHVTVGTGYEYKWSEEDSSELVRAAWPVLGLSGEDAERYPALAETLDAWSREKAETGEKNYTEMVEEADSYDSESDMSFAFSNEEFAYVQRADEGIVSVLCSYRGYSGGAHGFYGYEGYSFNPASGEQYALSDLLTDPDGFMACVKESVYADYPEVERDLTETYFAETKADEMIWTAGSDGITCYFNAYTLGPYAIGSQKAQITYEEHPEFFADVVKEAPRNYGTEVPLNDIVCFNGRRISLYGGYSENDSFNSVVIQVDGTETTDEIYAYGLEPTLLHVNGDDYLYLELLEDNDYRDILVYRLSGGAARTADTGLGRSISPDPEGSTSMREALTDPDAMRLAVRTQLLSTSSGERKYRVGTNGIPDPLESYYHFQWPRTLTLKEAHTFEEVDEDGNSKGECALEAGAQLEMMRTDNASAVDLTDPEGRLLRVQVNDEEWPQTADGINIEELFDGIMFAG